jgi:hypothetical protein
MTVNLRVYDAPSYFERLHVIFIVRRERLKARLRSLTIAYVAARDELHLAFPASLVGRPKREDGQDLSHGQRIAVDAANVIGEKVADIPHVGFVALAAIGVAALLKTAVVDGIKHLAKPTDQRTLEARVKKLEAEMGDVESSITATRLGDVVFVLVGVLILGIVILLTTPDVHLR